MREENVVLALERVLQCFCNVLLCQWIELYYCVERRHKSSTRGENFSPLWSRERERKCVWSAAAAAILRQWLLSIGNRAGIQAPRGKQSMKTSLHASTRERILVLRSKLASTQPLRCWDVLCICIIWWAFLTFDPRTILSMQLSLITRRNTSQQCSRKRQPFCCWDGEERTYGRI